MNNTFYVIPKDSDVKHYGVLGMKWGVRRYQNADGSLTAAGQRRYKQAETKIHRASRVAVRGAIGSLLGGPVGAALGIASGYYDDAKKQNKRHLERDMTKMQQDRLRDADKKNINYLTPESKMARSLYTTVKPNASAKEIQGALHKSFHDAKRNNNIEDAFSIAAGIGAMAIPILLKAKDLKDSYDSVKNAERATENIKNWSKNFNAKDYVNFNFGNYARDNSSNINYGRAYTEQQARDYYGIDISRLKSAGGDF